MYEESWARSAPGDAEFVGGWVANEFGQDYLWVAGPVVAIPACGGLVVSCGVGLGIPFRDAELCETFSHRSCGGGKGRVGFKDRGVWG